MAWQGIEGHDAVVERFRAAIARGRLASTFLFVGPPGVGKRSFALKLAQGLLCARVPAAQLEPCGACDPCVQVLAGTHPDLHLIRKPEDRSFIPLAAFIGDDAGRVRQGLCHDIALKPYMGGRRVAIIDDADYLNEEGANSLLKTLEEPPPHSVLILIATSLEKQLPTIRSRSQIVRFGRLPDEVVARLLVSQEIVADAAEASRLAAFADGSLARAVELAGPELWAFRRELLAALAKWPLPSVRLTETLEEFVGEAGKEAAARRMRLRQAIAFAHDFYREALRTAAGMSPGADAELEHSLGTVSAAWRERTDLIVALVERCLDAANHVDRNANQSTLIACWIDDLARIVDSGRVQVAELPWPT